MNFRMKLKDTSTIKSLFSMPAIELHSSRLLERFKNNLTTEISNEDAPESSSQEEPMDVDMDREQEAVVPEDVPEEPCKSFMRLYQIFSDLLSGLYCKKVLWLKLPFVPSPPLSNAMCNLI